MADLEKLVLTIEARTKQFENALNKIEKNTGKFADKGTKHFKRFGKSVDRIESKVKGFGDRFGTYLKAGLIAKLTAEIAGGFDGMFDSIDQIGKVADKVGLTTDELQELQFAASQTGVAMTATNQAVQRFSRRLGEADDGAGALANVLKANNIAIRDSEGNFRPLIELLSDYSNVILSAESDQEKLRLAFIAFDSEGAAMVNTLRNGSAGLEELRQEARSTGAVLAEDLVRDTERINDEFDKLSRTIGVKLKSAFLSVIGYGGFVMDMFNDQDQRQLSTINRQIDDLQETISRFEREGEGSLFRRIIGQADGKGIERRKAQLEELLALRDKLVADSSPKPANLDADLFKGFGANDNTPARTAVRDADTKSRNRSAEAARQQTERVAELIQNMEFEAAQLGRNANQQELYNALTRAGVSLESEQGQAIRDAVMALQAKRAQMEAFEAVQERFEIRVQNLTDAFEYFGNTGLDVLETLVEGGNNLDDTMRRVALSIARAAAEAALFGRGPLAGLFGTSGGGALNLLARSLDGSLFSGGDPWSGLRITGPRKNGGLVLPGNMYVGGEDGPEPFIPTHAGRIEPNRPLALNDNVSGDGVVINFNVQTPDVQSFSQSKGQIAADLARAVSRGRRHM